MIQVPSEGLEDIKKVIPTLVNRIPIKLKPLPHSPGYVLGILNSISYCIWFFIFFYYEKLSGKRAERVTSLCFLFTNETGPAWGQTSLELGVRTAVPALCLTSPATLDQPLPLWAACSTSLSESKVTLMVSPEPSCPDQKTTLYLLLYPLPRPSQVHAEGSSDFLEGATGSNFLIWRLNSWPWWWEHSFLFWLYQTLISLPFPSLQHLEWFLLSIQCTGATGD